MRRRWPRWSPMPGSTASTWSKDARLACCHVRKVEPLGRALAGAGAWVTGLRADQSDGRGLVDLAGWDEERGLVKVAPLFDWSRERTRGVLRGRGRAGQPAPRAGLPSIGCQPCTRAVAPGRARTRRPLVVGNRRRARNAACTSAPTASSSGAPHERCTDPRSPSQARADRAAGDPAAVPPARRAQGRGRRAGRRGVWKAELVAAAGADVLVLGRRRCRSVRRGDAGRGIDRGRAARLGRERSDRRGAGARRHRRPRRERALRRRGARGGRAGQHHRPHRIVRRPVRDDRQPLAGGGRDFDRRRARRCSASRSGRGSKASCRSGLADWAQAAQAWRPRVKAAIADFADRRRFWQRFAGRRGRRSTGPRASAIMRRCWPRPMPRPAVR